MSPLVLPTELKLQILSFLDVKTVLLMRLTSTVWAQTTRLRTLWLTLFHKTRSFLPYSANIRSLVQQDDLLSLFPDSSLSSILESAVVHAYRSTQKWRRPRIRQPIQLDIKTSDSLSLLFIELFLDRWLLYAYTEGQVHLWDINPSTSRLDGGDSTPRQCASLNLGSRNWASLAASLDALDEYITIAVTRASIPSLIQVYRIRIRRDPYADLDKTTFELLHTLVSPVPQLVRMIHPTMQLMVLSSPSTIDVVVANTHATASLDVSGKVVEKRMSISPPIDDLEELMDGIVDVRIMETYVVVFKTRSIEVHPLVTDMTSNTEASHHTGYRLRNHFPLASVSFRSFSISDYIVDQGSVSFSFYGYDFLRGLFRFEVRIVSNQESENRHGPRLDLNCVGIYSMSDSIDKDSLLPMNSFPNIFARLNQDSGHALAGLSANSRGFVSTMALGPQGKRAVWVERRRSSTVREVLVWQKGEVGTEVLIPRQVVYCLESYDLREDLTHCAIGEVSGTIVLGNRAGNIFILGIDI